MKKMRWLAMLLALVMVAAACGSDEAEDTGTADGDTEESTDEGTDDTDEVDVAQGTDLTFHMITHSDDGPFWSVLKRGAEAAAEDVGVELVWQGSNNDPGVQQSDIEAAIAAGSDGIASSLPSPHQLIPVLQDAVAAGIPVYTLNSGVSDYQEILTAIHVGQT